MSLKKVALGAGIIIAAFIAVAAFCYFMEIEPVKSGVDWFMVWIVENYIFTLGAGGVVLIIALVLFGFKRASGGDDAPHVHPGAAASSAALQRAPGPPIPVPDFQSQAPPPPPDPGLPGPAGEFQPPPTPPTAPNPPGGQWSGPPAKARKQAHELGRANLSRDEKEKLLRIVKALEGKISKIDIAKLREKDRQWYNKARLEIVDSKTNIEQGELGKAMRNLNNIELFMRMIELNTTSK